MNLYNNFVILSFPKKDVQEKLQDFQFKFKIRITKKK